VQAESKRKGPEGCQWNVISRQIHALEAVVFFEIAQAIALFFFIGKVLLDKVRNLAFSARAHGLSD